MLQLVATGAAAMPLLLHMRGDTVSTGELFGSALFTTFAGAASCALWFYGQRYIGELTLCNRSQMERATGAEGSDVAENKHLWVCISTLDFWGRRQVLQVSCTHLLCTHLLSIMTGNRACVSSPAADCAFRQP